MIDRAATPDAPSEPTHEEVGDSAISSSIANPLLHEPLLESSDAASPPQALPPTLEDRVRQLEEKVAVLQDTRRLEERITERIARRVEKKQANTAIKAPVAALAEPAKPPPIASVAPPPEPPSIVVVEGKNFPTRWLILDILAEFRAMVQMFLDARYRVFCMTWQTKVYPILLLGLMFLSWLMISGIPIVGLALDKAAELILAFFLYKVLSREACRYREIGPQMRGHR
jgi:hypothetical protein